MFVSATQDFRQHQTTAHLAQTMSFLALPIAELETKLLTELDENPALELVEELRCPGCGKRLAPTTRRSFTFLSTTRLGSARWMETRVSRAKSRRPSGSTSTFCGRSGRRFRPPSAR